MPDTFIARKRYSIRELYDVTYHAVRTAPFMRTARTQGLDKPFIERIMLAVTGVNGCDLCAWAHVRVALEAGLDDAEIGRMLAGELAGIPPDQAAAILFARHYADTKGHPSPEAWQRIVTSYGPPLANGILGATRAIMWGNVSGIPAGSFLQRLRGRAQRDSSIGYELSMLLATALFMPVAIVHAIASTLRGVPLVSFGRKG